MNSPVHLLFITIPLLMTAFLLADPFKLGLFRRFSRRSTQRAIMAYVQPTQSGTIVEFGAGWRTMATSLARAHPNRTIVVYQSSLLIWTFLRLRSALAGTSNLSVRREAFQEANLSPAAAIICFRLPQSAPLLEKRFHIELAPGTLVISRNFTLPGWSIQQSAKLNNRNKTRINTYTVHG